jgi:flagellar biosynthetic protein FliQ
VSAAFVLEAVRQAMLVALLVAAPLLLCELVVGLFVSVIQAVTQIQEQTLTFVPKLLALGLVLMLVMPWILRILVTYIEQTLRSLPTIAI